MCENRKKNKKKKNNKHKETKPIFEVAYLKVILLKFGMWSTEVGGRGHSKNHLVSSRKHRAMEVPKLGFRSSCQYTHGCCALASWEARHTTMCLD